MSKEFYVYAHRKINGEIFYIGKGCGKRAWDTEGRSRYWENTVNLTNYHVEILISGLQEWYAIELEKDLIAYHGRKDLGYGLLVNQVDGGDKLGEGSNNPMYGKGYLQAGNLNPMYGRKHSEDHKKVISETTKKALANPETRRKQAEYTKTNNPMNNPDIRNKHLSIMKSEEFRKNMSLAMSGENNPMFGRTGKSAPAYGRTGEKHPMFGRTGEKHPLFGRTGDKSWMKGTFVINDGLVSKRVKPDKLSEYLEMGWFKGFVKRK